MQAEQVKRIPYFQDLDPRLVERVRGAMVETQVAKGKLLLSEGEPAEAMYGVLTGQVKIFKLSPDGREQVLRIAGPGQTFNEVPMFDGGPNPANAQALEPAVVWGIRRTELLQLLAEHPAIAAGFLKAFAARLRHLTRKVEDLSFRSVTSRVAKLLLEMAEEDGQGGLRLSRQFTQQEFATMVGTAREMIGRAFKALEREGAIKLDRHRVVIISRATLAQMV